jgi:hypothetical protein
VVEGDDEEAFVKHVLKLFVHREAGLSVSVKNAHGKGARNVIKTALREKRRGGYGRVAALFDTDTNWGQTEKTMAKKGKIDTLPSAPCLEASLLLLLGDDPSGESSATLKNRLESRLGGHPPRHPQAGLSIFTKERIISSRTNIPMIDQLLTLLGLTA